MNMGTGRISKHLNIILRVHNAGYGAIVLGPNDQCPAICIGKSYKSLPDILRHQAYFSPAIPIGSVKGAFELAKVTLTECEVILQALLN